MSDVVFVYLGNSLPRYVDGSLRLAAKYSGQRPVLLANSPHGKQVEKTGAEFVAVEEFYDPSAFRRASEKILQDHDFRQRFFLYTFERFFVLEQFMAWKGSESLFHAELDQLLFGTNELVEYLDKTKKRGLFFPSHSPTKAVASVLFVNRRLALKKLIQFGTEGEPFHNEMELLVRFTKAFPEYSIELPTIGAAIPHPGNQKFVFTGKAIKPGDLGPGVVDAAELGLWVGGRDPRNLGIEERPSTKWVYEDHKVSLGRKYLEELRFRFDYRYGRLELSHNQSPGDSIRLYNLHIHSKIHGWIWRHDSRLQRLFESANSSSSLQIRSSRRLQLSYLFAEQKDILGLLRLLFRFGKYAIKSSLVTRAGPPQIRRLF